MLSLAFKEQINASVRRTAFASKLMLSLLNSGGKQSSFLLHPIKTRATYMSLALSRVQPHHCVSLSLYAWLFILSGH